MSRRCRPLIAAAVAAMAGVALAAGLCVAQTVGPGSGQLPDPLTDQMPDSGTIQTQSPYSDFDLLQPSLEGNPAPPPRFRRPRTSGAVADQAPATDTFTTPSRIGATPTYGSAAAFGAGGTGFDSMNLPRGVKKKLAQKPPPAPLPGVETPETTFESLPTTEPAVPPPPAPPPAPPPPEIYPKTAANRIGATLPPPAEPLPVSNPPPVVYPLSAARRPGANVPVPPPSAYELPTDISADNPPPAAPPINTLPLGTPAQQPLPFAAGDPYSAVGIRGSSFMFFPAVEFSTAYDTNPQHIPGGAASPYFVVAPELKVQSDWSRHSFTANITGSYTDYSNGSFEPSLNRPYLNSTIDGRIDVTRDTQIVLENRLLVSTDNPGSPNLTAGLAKLPIDTTVGGTLGVIQDFNRLTVSLKASLDRVTYQDSVLTNGETSSNGDRNLDQYAVIARVGYELNPGMKPFVEVQEDERIHDEQFDRNGEQRDSDGSSFKLGTVLDLFGTLSGEIAFGYLDRIYKDPTLPNIGGATANGSLIWEATELTTAKLTASTVVNESILAGVSGSLSRDVNLQVDHALRRWLIATLKVGYGHDDYLGLGRDDDRYFASIGLQYILNRDISVRGELRHDWLRSTATGVAYDSTSFLAGIRLQR